MKTQAKALLLKLGRSAAPTDTERSGFRGMLAQESDGVPGAGEVGERIESLVALGSAVSLTTATAANVTSILLTPGAWRVHGHVNLNAGSATRTAASAGISETSATLPTDGSEVTSGIQTTTTSHKDAITLQSKKVYVAKGTTKRVYLVASATFSAGTVTGYGGIAADRVH